MSLNSKSPPSYGQGQLPPQGMAGLGALAARMAGRQPMQGQPPPPPGGPPPQAQAAMQAPPPPPPGGPPPQGMAGLGAAAARLMPKTQERMAGALRRFQQR